MSIAKTLLTFAGGVVVGAVAKPAIKGVKKLFSKEEKVTEKQETGKKKEEKPVDKKTADDKKSAEKKPVEEEKKD